MAFMPSAGRLGNRALPALRPYFRRDEAQTSRKTPAQTCRPAAFGIADNCTRNLTSSDRHRPFKSRRSAKVIGKEQGCFRSLPTYGERNFFADALICPARRAEPVLRSHALPA